MKRILHPTDFSKASGAAFKKAVELARTMRATLDLLHVMAPVAPVLGYGDVSPQTYDQLAASGTRWAQQEMERLVKKARAAGVKTTSTMVEGVPVDRIVRAARARHADLVVMGTHGRTGWSRFFLGSVASRVVATSPSPVLTVRGR
jgi:nucleotide-binding universal stress UspA family protein